MPVARAAFLIVLASFASATSSAAPPAKAPKVGEPAPALDGALRADGRAFPFDWKSHRGQVVVLSFNASWCAPCRDELSALAKLMDKWARFHRPPVTLVAINIDDELEDGRKFIDALNLSKAASLFDPTGKVAARYRPKVMPMTYIIDGAGIIRAIHRGYEKGDEAVLDKEIRGVLRAR